MLKSPVYTMCGIFSPADCGIYIPLKSLIDIIVSSFKVQAETLNSSTSWKFTLFVQEMYIFFV